MTPPKKPQNARAKLSRSAYNWAAFAECAPPDDGEEGVQPGRVAVKLEIAQIPPPGDQDRQPAGDQPADHQRSPVVEAQGDDQQRQRHQRDQEAEIELRQQARPGDDADQRIHPVAWRTFGFEQQHDQQKQQVAEQVRQVVVVDRPADEQEHRQKGVERRRAQRDFRALREQLAPQPEGDDHRPQAEQHRKESGDVDGERYPVPGEGFQVSMMHDHVGVAVGADHADVGVRVLPPNHVEIGRVDGRGDDGGDQIIQRRLAALLPPRRRHRRVLHRQRQAVRRQILNHRVMPQLVGCLEHGCDDAVDRRQHQIRREDGVEDTLHADAPVTRAKNSAVARAISDQSN
ncbi:MAG: hypothetical protein U0703_17360 [Anaerolineae bacterium]